MHMKHTDHQVCFMLLLFLNSQIDKEAFESSICFALISRFMSWLQFHNVVPIVNKSLLVQHNEI